MKIKFIRLSLISLIFIIYGCNQSPTNYSIPSSNEIAFVRWSMYDYKFGCELWTMDVNGKNQHCLLKNKNVGRNILGISWSPDGEKIAFVQWNKRKKFIPQFPQFDTQKSMADATKDYFSEIKMIDLDKKKTIKLLKKEGFITEILWSPNGEEIIFKWGEKKIDVYSFNIAQQKIKKLIDSEAVGGIISYLSFFPDGKNVIFQGIGAKVYIMDLNNKDLRRLTNTPSEIIEWAPVLSPDGKWIAFNEVNPKCEKNSSWNQIVVINPAINKRCEIQIPKKWFLLEKIAFSPCSKKLIFERGGVVNKEGTRINHELFIIDIDGKNLKSLINTPEWDESYPSWRPIPKN